MKLPFAIFIFSFLLGSFYFPAVVHAQHVINIIDENSGLPLAAVQVDILNDNKAVESSVFTQDNGQAVISASLPIQVQVWAVGYEMMLVNITESQQKIGLHKVAQVLNDVVITGVVNPVKRKEALNLITTINKSTLDRMGAVTLDQALAYQPNISIGNDAVLGTTIRMMGLSGSNVKVLIDGLPLNGRENGNINLSQINLYNTEKIEVLNGPMSLIYGSDALGGVINVITKRDKIKKALQLHGHYETVGRYNVYVQGQLPILKRHSLSGGIGRNFFSGYHYLDTGDLKRRMLFKPTEQYPAHLTYSYKAPSGFTAQLATDGLHETIQDKGSANKSTVGAYAQDQYYKTNRLANRLLMRGNLFKNMHWQSGTGFMYYQRNRSTLSKDLVTLHEEVVPMAGMQDTSVFIDLNQRVTVEHQLGAVDYSAGVDLTYSSGSSSKLAQSRAVMYDNAIWAAVRSKIFKDKLSLQFGLRATANSLYDVPVLPSAQLLFVPVKRLQFRANYTRAYRAPSLKELYLEFIDPQHKIMGNANLLPEQGTHYQVAAAWQIWDQGNNYFQFTTNGFHNRVINQISLVPTNPADSNSIDYSYGNVARLNNYIINGELQYQHNGFYAQLGYNWGSNFLPLQQLQFNEQSIQAQVNYFWKKPALNFALFYRYYGPRPYLRGNIDGSASYEGKQPGYNTADASLSKTLWKRKLRATAGVKNIFNTTQLVATGLSGATGAHSGNGTQNFLPRSGFASLQLSL